MKTNFARFQKLGVPLLAPNVKAKEERNRAENLQQGHHDLFVREVHQKIGGSD
jgi:hypothetical protein